MGGFFPPHGSNCGAFANSVLRPVMLAAGMRLTNSTLGIHVKVICRSIGILLAFSEQALMSAYWKVF